MKAVGGRRSQIAWMYLALVAVYGLLAVAVGLPIGLWASSKFTDYAAGVLNFRLASDTPPSWVIGLVLVVGVLVPIAAAAFPVSRGARMSVVSALDAAGPGAHFGHGLIDRVWG